MNVRSIGLAALSFCAPDAYARPITLGTPGSCGALAGSAVIHTGSSVVTGNLGVSPGSAVTGFPPGTVSGAINAAGAIPMQAETDLTTVYNAAADQTATETLTNQNFPGMIPTPGAVTMDDVS